MGTIRSAATFLRKAGGAAAVLFLLSLPLEGAPSFVKAVAIRTRTSTTNSSITASVPASGVAAGNSLILTLQAGDVAGDLSCSDPVNGVYAANVVTAAGTTRAAILSRHDVAALGFGTVITCTYPQFSGPSSLGVYEFSGLEPSGTLDQTSEGGSSVAGAASSGLTAATAQAAELVFGLFWVSPGMTFAAATSGGNPLESPYAPPYSPITGAGTQRPIYRFVGSIRQYEANGTVGGTGLWKALVATYRLAPDLCAGVDCGDGNDCTADSCDPATGACGHAPEPLGLLCGDRSSGICDAVDRCDGAGACLSNHVADGTACGETDSDCEAPDTCQQGICQDNGFRPAGTACGSPTVGSCDAADSCDSSGVCLQNHAADGTTCGDAGTECVRQDTCLAGGCQDNGFAAAGAACGDASSGACDEADACDGSGACLENHTAGGTGCDDTEECTTDDACDGSGACVGDRDALCFACKGNVAPDVADEVLAVPGDPIPLADGRVALTAFFADSPPEEWECVVDWGDGGLPDRFAAIEPAGADPGRCAGNHLYTAPGVREVAVDVADVCGASDGTVHRYVVVYDSSAGFAAGSGWVPSPAGAYRDDPAAAGRVVFGLAARAGRAGAAPTGEIRFHFEAGGLRFVSSTFESLVISGARARLRGTGAANGVADHVFELTAWDGQAPSGGGLDRFRIKVWQGNPDHVVYDNLPGQPDNADPAPLGGGTIVLSKK